MTHSHPTPALGAVAAALALFAGISPAHAQEEQPHKTRVALGPKLIPSYPGASDVSLRPYIDVSRSRADEPFDFEAPDESFGFALLHEGGWSAGPVLAFQGKRSASDVGAPVPHVGFTVEPGAFVQVQMSDAIRVRAEGRKGIGGHHGWIGSVGADYVARDGDRWLFSAGPRVTLADARYHRAYFGVPPATAAATGLAPFRPGGGVEAIGVTTGVLKQISGRWGVAAYAKYDRLVSDAARSPLVRGYGSRNQVSGGAALSYTFGKVVETAR